MSDPEPATSTLPQLDRTDDPRGAAAGWALLVVGATLIAGILLIVKWAIGAW
jgi:hypothetical protein